MLINKINKILTKKQKRLLPIILLLFIFSMILETLSIALIFPLLELIFNEEFIKSIYIISDVIQFFERVTGLSLLPIVCIFILSILILKSFFLIFSYNYQARFASTVLVEQSSLFFNLYIRQSWLFHSSKNSSIFIRNILSEVGNFMGFTEAAIIIFAESFIFIGIMCLLFFLDFYITLITFFTILFLSIIFNKISKKYLIKWGDQRHYNDSFRIKYLNEAFSSIKEIKIFQKENYFVNKFNFHNIIVAKTRQYRKVFSQLPRIFLEFVIVTIILLIILFFYYFNFNLQQDLAKLGIFFASFLRLIPSTNKIIHAYQTFKFNKKSIDNLYDDYVNLTINELDNNFDRKINFKKNILIKNLNFQYNKNNEYIFKNLNLDLKFNSCVGLIGRSGVGKTTFIDLLLGILKPNQGNILVDGQNIFDNLSSWKSIIGYVPQNVFLMDDSIKSNIAFGLDNKDINLSKINRSIEMAELKELVDNLTDGIDTNIGENGVKLSGGQKQRIGIARALYNDPEFIIFDESTSSLDEKTEKSILDTIFQLKNKKTMIIISHKESVVSICDKIYQLNDGDFIIK